VGVDAGVSADRAGGGAGGVEESETGDVRAGPEAGDTATGAVGGAGVGAAGRRTGAAHGLGVSGARGAVAGGASWDVPAAGGVVPEVSAAVSSAAAGGGNAGKDGDAAATAG
jgi:hypothetical protein